MPAYHLLSTKRQNDGSFATPSIDETFQAPDAGFAIRKARHFPLDAFDGQTDFTWLVDESGQMLWSNDLTISDAA